MAAGAGRSLDLAAILRAHAPPLEQLGIQRRRVVRDIVSCRTAALGGHLQVCDTCGRETPIYNSCRNRHCPRCQSLDQARWVEAQARDLLPVPYFHVVFTVPRSVHPFILADRRQGYALLFRTAVGTLHEVCRSRLGATPGTIAVLHTWSQTLTFHPHIHCVVTGGGLDAGRQRWVSTRPRFFLPVRILSTVFRAKLLDALARDCRPGCTATRRLLRQAAALPWVVYSKPPMAGPEQVLVYLGRYTHRIAIGNERLVRHAHGDVTFRYRDRAHGNRRRLLTLAGPEFVRRFLLHVLPRSFVRVRHFGLQANCCRATLMPRARMLLHADLSPPLPGQERVPWRDLYRRLTGRDPDLCPCCGQGRLRIVAVLPPSGSRQARAP